MTPTKPRIGLHLGRLLDVPSAPLILSGQGFTAHTLIVGQSGSGKSFMLGRLLEEIAVATTARLLVLDPNSDFLSFPEVSQNSWSKHKAEFLPMDAEADFRESWRDLDFGVVTARTEKELGFTNSRVSVMKPTIPFPETSAALELADLLAFDIRVDVDEVYAINRVLNRDKNKPPKSLEEFRLLAESQWKENKRQDAAERADARLYLRTTELLGLDVWAEKGETGSVPSQVADLFSITSSRRILSLDIASLEKVNERLIVANAALQSIWDAGRRAWSEALKMPTEQDERRPVFVVIDEAHNLAPSDPAHGLQRTVLDALTRIATEGRKYGIYLILVTQRPSRLDATLRSQCDNLCLLKMNDRYDLALIEQSFGFIPQGWAQRALDFRKGDLLLAGAFSDRPLYAHVSPRRTIEGGRSLIDKMWLPHIATAN
jgi:uncharacterized protein